MSTVSSIFSQVLKLIPRAAFDAAVHKHQAERNAKGFTSWGQFVAMLFCQLGSVSSLRDITNGLAASEGKLRHLGLPAAPKRSTLAYANSHRLRIPVMWAPDYGDVGRTSERSDAGCFLQ